MISASRAAAPVLVDASALDNAHATRGIGRYTSGVLMGLDASGADVVKLRQTQTSDPRSVVPVRPWPRCSMPWRQTIHLQRALPELLGRTGARHLHLLDPLPMPPPRKGLVLSATVLDLIPLLVPEHRIPWRDEWGLARLHYHRVFLSRLRCADALVAISNAVRDDIVDALGIPSERIRVIHLGSDSTPLSGGATSSEEHRLLAECTRIPYFLFTGAADRRKNLDRLLDALAMSSLPHRLILAGRPGEANRRRLERKATSLGMQDRLVFAGFVSDAALASLYRQAVALVFPSFAEGFGLPILEAMREGCPVLTSRGHCLEEIAGDAALLVDPLDVQDISNGLRRIAADVGLRDLLRSRGNLRHGEFSWQRCARELQEFWSSLA